jgi:hypothetical protein
LIVPVLLYGPLATHRRGRILQEALAATPSADLPDGRAAVLAFAEAFQGAEDGVQARLIEWTRTPGRLLLLLPPFAAAACERPVPWRAERMESAPEVGYRLTGKLQTPAVPGATWSDLSVALGLYRLHPAAGLFAVTCLPLWSLAVLDAHGDLESWFTSLVSLAGENQPAEPTVAGALTAEHYGFLVFLLSQTFTDEAQAIAALLSSYIFRFSSERGRLLLRELQDQGLVDGAKPTTEAYELVMQSPYAAYVGALREVSR